MKTRSEGPDASLIAECHQNLIATFEWLARIVPGASVDRFAGLTAVRTGMPGRSFNVLFALELPTSLSEVREGVDHAFVRRKTPFQVFTTSATADALRPLVEDSSLTTKLDLPGMVLDPLPLSCPDPPAELQIRKVEGTGDVLSYLRTGARGFAMPLDYFDSWSAGISKELEGNVYPGANYHGLVSGRPASTSLRFSTGRVAGNYFVSTLPEFRRRGYAEAMTWRAAVDGRKEGCTRSYLQASPMGRPVYEHMGYRTIEWYQEWGTETPPTG